MSSELDRFFAEAQKKKCSSREAGKRELAEKLLREGYFDKEYSPDGLGGADFPETETDPGSGEKRFYKKVPLELSDGDYERLKEYFPGAAERNESTAVMAVVLRVIVWVGLVVYWVFLVHTPVYLGIILSVVTAAPLLALADIIERLDRIERRLGKSKK